MASRRAFFISFIALAAVAALLGCNGQTCPEGEMLIDGRCVTTDEPDGRNPGESISIDVLYEGVSYLDFDASNTTYVVDVGYLTRPLTLTVSPPDEVQSISWKGESVALDPDGRLILFPDTGTQSELLIGTAATTYEIRINRARADDLAATAYLKGSEAISRPSASGAFSVALAANKDRIVVGEPDRPDGGSVVVYRRIDETFAIETEIRATNTEAGDEFGASVALFGDLLVVGAPGESSNATGVNGDALNDDVPDSGAVYVFEREPAGWREVAYLKGRSPRPMRFGSALALDETTLAIGAPDSTQLDVVVGAAYVFERTGAVWRDQQWIPSPTNNMSIGQNRFGSALAVHGDTLAVGSPGDIAGAGLGAGTVWLFARSDDGWSDGLPLSAPFADPADGFGGRVALDETTLVVTASSDDSSASGVGSPSQDDSLSDSGAAYLYARNGDDWELQAYFKASNPDERDFFGSSVALYGDVLLLGAAGEDGSANDVGTAGSDNSAPSAGAVYVFERRDENWAEAAYVKAPNSDEEDAFGTAVAMSATMIVVGAPGESSQATGVDGEENDNTAPNSGAAYVFR